MAEKSWSVGEDTCSTVSCADESQPLYGWNLSPKGPKRLELDESTFHKTDYPPIPTDTPIRDSGNLTALIQTASKYAPLRTKPCTSRRQVPTRKRPPALYGHSSISHQLDALRDIQRDLADLQRDYNNAVFMEQWIYLDRLQPYVNLRLAIIMDKPAIAQSIEEGTVSSSSQPQVWKGFWLKVLEECLPTSLMICPWDRPLLRHLLDIRCTNIKDITAFTLEFVFGPNPYFSNAVLQRRFDFRLMSKGEIVGDLRGLPSYVPLSCTGCNIGWFPNKNGTVTHKQSSPKEGTAPRRSFFNYFSPLTTGSSNIDANLIKKADVIRMKKLFELDFYIAHVIKTRLIPHALAFYEGQSNEVTQVRMNLAGLHPARKALSLDVDRMWTEAELTSIEDKFIKLDLGIDYEGDRKNAEVELEKDVRSALGSVGYKIRHECAYHQQEMTTSGQSSSDSDGQINGEEARRKTYRGLLETNTVKVDRRHAGVKIKDMNDLAEKAVSDDDQVLYKEMDCTTESEDESSLESDNMMNARKVKLNQKKTGKFTQKRKKTTGKKTG